MPAGRPRKSLGQHVVDGTYRPNRHDGHCEVVARGKPIKPDDLSKEEEWLWQLVVNDRCAAIDTAQLRQLCRAWHCLVAAGNAAREDPLHKEHRIAFCQYSAAFDKLAQQFGLSPVSRTRIKQPYQLQEDGDNSRFFGISG